MPRRATSKRPFIRHAPAKYILALLILAFQLAKQFHPDTNKTDKDAASKFQEAQEAYEVRTRARFTASFACLFTESDTLGREPARSL